MLHQATGANARGKSVWNHIVQLVVSLTGILVGSLIGASLAIAFYLALTTTPYEREVSYENGRLSNSIWPVRAWDWSIDRTADLLQAHWVSLLVAFVLLIGWWVFAYIRWGSFLPRHTNR